MWAEEHVKLLGDKKHTAYPVLAIILHLKGKIPFGGWGDIKLKLRDIRC
jgi:hypothetical protein